MNAILGMLLGLCAFGGGGDDDKKPAAASFELVLKPTVMARGCDVTIAEIADVLPAGREAAEIGRIVFGPAPIAGYARTVSRTELLQALAGAGQQVGRFACKGATEASVQSVSTEVAAQDITDAAETALRAVLALESADEFEVELQTRMRHQMAPAGRDSRDLRARVRGTTTGTSSAIVDVEIRVDGQQHRVLPVQYRIVRYAMVLKTSASVLAGMPLGPENLELQRERQTTAPGLYATKFKQVAGKIARRALKPGAVLTLNDVGEPALIHRGERVTVVLQRGAVHVTMKAIANTDAGRGERIVVTNMDSRAQIECIASAPGTVIARTR